MAVAILGLLTALIPVLLWYVKRKHSPTLEERLDDARRAQAALMAEVVEARRRGDDARAESLLRRLRAQVLPGPGRVSGNAGQCGSDGTPGGDAPAVSRPEND